MVPKLILWVFLICYSKVLVNSATTQSSFVISTPSTKEDIQEIVKDGDSSRAKIYEMKIHTNVSNRYAKTSIRSKVRNFRNVAQEVTFSVILPKSAFISGFTLEIGGKSYEAYVEEKKKAKRQYQKALELGLSAAHVAVSARDSNRFTVSINVEAEEKATFNLRYEELLTRKDEKYEIVYNINPGQLVKDLEVLLNITESRPLKFVTVPTMRSGNEIGKIGKVDPEANVNVDNNTATVSFRPTLDKQNELGKEISADSDGLSGQFVIQYDVERDPYGGEVLVDDDYFVHFFAPENLEPLKKQVMFVLDVSGSMSGRKLKQLKEAIVKILGQLNNDDIFSIIQFSSSVGVWDVPKSDLRYVTPDDEEFPTSVDASVENVNKAQNIVKKFGPTGTTNIYDALDVAIKIAQRSGIKSHQPIVLFLTDGNANIGKITNHERIVSGITDINENGIPIFSLSFGEDADKSFLQKLSLKNHGFWKHIYEASDASLQLENFYKEVSSPLLSNVTFKYVNNVTNVTDVDFPLYFAGSELFVSGIKNRGFLPPEIEAVGLRGPVRLTPKVYRATGSLERLWAYLTVKQLLQKDDKGAQGEALRIALKYSFVTDVTSLVVVKPNSTDRVDKKDAYVNPGRSSNFNGVGFSQTLGLGGRHGSGLLGMRGSYGSFGNMKTRRPAHASRMRLQPTNFDTYRYFDVQFSNPPRTTVQSQIPPELSWLKGLIDGNGKISVKNGTFKVDFNKSVPLTPTCANAPDDAAGVCRMIHECTHIFQKLVDVQSYSKYFCELVGYAGVCCPPKPINGTVVVTDIVR